MHQLLLSGPFLSSLLVPNAYSSLALSALSCASVIYVSLEDKARRASLCTTTLSVGSEYHPAFPRRSARFCFVALESLVFSLFVCVLVFIPLPLCSCPFSCVVEISAYQADLVRRSLLLQCCVSLDFQHLNDIIDFHDMTLMCCLIVAFGQARIPPDSPGIFSGSSLFLISFRGHPFMNGWYA